MRIRGRILTSTPIERDMQSSHPASSRSRRQRYDQRSTLGRVDEASLTRPHDHEYRLVYQRNRCIPKSHKGGMRSIRMRVRRVSLTSAPIALGPSSSFLASSRSHHPGGAEQFSPRLRGSCRDLTFVDGEYDVCLHGRCIVECKKAAFEWRARELV